MSFIIQAIFSGLLALIILFIPEIYFSSTLNSEKDPNESSSDKNSVYKKNTVDKDRKSSLYNDSSLIFTNENPSIFSNFCKIFCFF